MTTLMPPAAPVGPAPPEPGRPRWVVPLVLAVVALVALAAVAVALLTRSGEDVTATVEPAGTPSAAGTPAATPAAPAPVPVDCSVVPPAEAFAVGTTHPCFSDMGERFALWLGANSASTAGSGYVPGDTFTAAEVENVSRVQLLMGDPPDGRLGQAQWSRLLSEGPPALTELRTTGIGPLWFGMTADQLRASGVASVEQPAEGPPMAALVGVDAYGCFGAGEFYAVILKGPSNVVTVEGITTASTPADLTRAFGERLVVREAPMMPTGVDYAVYDGDVGYAFFVQDDGSLQILAGTRAEVDRSAGGPHGLCGE